MVAVRENDVISPILNFGMFEETTHQINVLVHVVSSLIFVLAHIHNSLRVDVEFSAAVLRIVHLFDFRWCLLPIETKVDIISE